VSREVLQNCGSGMRVTKNAPVSRGVSAFSQYRPKA
jgi:hypothetical protein